MHIERSYLNAKERKGTQKRCKKKFLGGTIFWLHCIYIIMI